MPADATDRRAAIVPAPWTLEQVASINGYQQSGAFHEFTCPFSDDHAAGRVLVAVENALGCPSCAYVQFWVWNWMADWEWRQYESWLRAMITAVKEGRPG